ncbi:mandelate racemase/muconate lactonizing enzyme family protein [Pseudonocardia acaciae]|uniref:mandelate racemase/muconate lactonizing enzyme family protein n=1 Tax=Pseudonocardia acaciae TaxID=551276 RepID=UPI0006882C10|nr:mandelate racemase/muconate lactonizing enzyme family protein [Pseudonocardia acaciae]
MRIEDVHALGLRGATPRGGWARELEPADVVHTLVVVTTDGGVVGYGSVFTSEDLVRAALAVLRDLLLGESAVEPERVAEKLHRHTFWQGRGGAVTHTVGGIDIALWDILGKVTGQPVGRLLGGTYRDRVMPYASLLADSVEQVTSQIAELREHGFRAFKIGWGALGRKDRRYDEKLVAAAREAADDATVAVDVGASDANWPHGYKWALATARMLADYDVAWLEEPLDPDHITEYAMLRRAAAVPIAGGEVLTRRQSFVPFLDAYAWDIVQPDVTKVGGLSEQRRIGWYAQERGVRLIPHGWNTAVGLASDLQLASALPGTDLVEYKTGSPYIDEIVRSPWTLDADGMLAVPDRPGLGIALDPEAVGRYCDVPPALRHVLLRDQTEHNRQETRA